jgi:hypothetical protein
MPLPVTNVYQKEETNISSVYTMAPGQFITYYKLPAYNDANFNTSTLSHLWGNLSLRTLGDYNVINQSYGNGGWLNTALAGLIESFYTSGAIAFVVDNERYRNRIYGQNVAMTIPINSSFSGSTSGFSATTLYSSFVYSPANLNKSTTSICAGCIVDTYSSEASVTWTNDQGIGFKYTPGTNPNTNNTKYPYFESGVVYLMSDKVYNTFSGATGSSNSWGYLYNQTNKYANGARQISTDPSNTQYLGTGGYDRIAGVLFLNSGLGFIFDKQLVQAFDTTKLNGDWTTVTGATTTSGFTNFVAADYDLAEFLNVNIVAGPNDWVSSTNSSYIGTNQDCGIAISTITLHDQNGECLAIAKPDKAIIKEEGESLVLDLKLPISGPLAESLATTVGRTDCNVSGIPC